MKKCINKNCKTENPRFTKDFSKPDGLGIYCSDCARKKQLVNRQKKQYYQTVLEAPRVCANCNVEKKTKDFRQNKSSSDGRNKICIECISVFNSRQKKRVVIHKKICPDCLEISISETDENCESCRREELLKFGKYEKEVKTPIGEWNRIEHIGVL